MVTKGVLILLLIMGLTNLDNSSLKEEEVKEIKEIIDVVRATFNVSSVEFDYVSTLYLNPKISLPEVKSIRNKFTFKYQNGNFFFSKALRSRRNNKKEDLGIDNPKNILELLIKKYSDRSKLSYNSLDNHIFYINVYFFNGEGSFRNISCKEDNSEAITFLTINDWETKDEYSRYGAARYFLGYIGFTMDSSDSIDYSTKCCPVRKITDLLDMPGITTLRVEGDYRVLFHCVKLPCNTQNCPIYREDEDEKFNKLMREYIEWFSFEIWVDKNNNIKKIIEVDYLPIIYGEDLVNKLCGYNSDKFAPYEIRKIIEFEDFQEFSHNVKIPLKVKIFFNRCPFLLLRAVGYEDTYTDNIFLIRDYKEEKISARELRILSHCYGSNENNYFGNALLEIDPQTLKVNQPIPDNLFKAPPVMNDHRKEMDEEKTNEGTKRIILSFLVVIGVISAVFIPTSIIRKYPDWKVRR